MADSEFEDTPETKEERYNAIVRGAAHAGLSIFQMLEEELAAAKVAARSAEGDKAVKAQGRVTGLAQAIAIMRSPYSWRDGSNATRVKLIKREMA
jgi:hypothetical protein